MSLEVLFGGTFRRWGALNHIFPANTWRDFLERLFVVGGRPPTIHFHRKHIHDGRAPNNRKGRLRRPRGGGNSPVAPFLLPWVHGDSLGSEISTHPTQPCFPHPSSATDAAPPGAFNMQECNPVQSVTEQAALAASTEEKYGSLARDSKPVFTYHEKHRCYEFRIVIARTHPMPV